MRYRKLGHSGLKVSEIALGSWFDGQPIQDEWALSHILGEAFEKGINYIDMADIYHKGETESLFGKLLKSYPRQNLVLSSKCYWPMSESINDQGLSRKHIFESLHASLKRLGTDYLDLYLCHAEDPDTPLEETIRALADLIKQGKILHWGVCSWQSSTLIKVKDICENLQAPLPITHQVIYNLLEFHPQREHLPLAKSLGLGVTVWSPFAGGILAHGNLQRCLEQQNTESSYLRHADVLWRLPHQEQANKKLALFTELAQEANLTKAQLALAWILRREEVSSIVTGLGSSNHLENQLALYEKTVSEEIFQEVEYLFEVDH